MNQQWKLLQQQNLLSLIEYVNGDIYARNIFRQIWFSQHKVVSQQEPGLLPEHGGSLRLNTTWAKSMLRRLNIRAKHPPPSATAWICDHLSLP